MHDEDAWAPKWDDDEASPQGTPQAAASLQAAAPQAAAPMTPPPPPQADVPPEFLLPGQQPQQLQQLPLPQLQPVPKAPAASDVLSGPNTPALQPPPVAVVAASPPAPPAGDPVNGLANGLGAHGGGSSAGSAASSGGGGALIFAGDFATRQNGFVASPPASPTPQQLAGHMAALDVGPAAKQQQTAPPAAFPPAMATGGAAGSPAAEEPEEFEDLLDMLMT